MWYAATDFDAPVVTDMAKCAVESEVERAHRDGEVPKNMITEAERCLLSVRTGQVLAYVRARAETTPADVADDLGLDPRRASEILIRLTRHGLIRKQARGLYGPDAATRDGL